MYSTLYSYVYDGRYVCIFHVSETLKDSVLGPRGENNKRAITEPKSLLPRELRSGRENYIFFMKSTSESQDSNLMVLRERLPSTSEKKINIYHLEIFP